MDYISKARLNLTLESMLATAYTIFTAVSAYKAYDSLVAEEMRYTVVFGALTVLCAGISYRKIGHVREGVQYLDHLNKKGKKDVQ